MHFHKPQIPPRLWGNFQTRQYAIWDNLEKIYDCDHESEVLIMPLFWGLPPRDYSKYGNDGTNYGATHQNGSLSFDGVNDYVSAGSESSLDITGNITIKAIVNASLSQTDSYPNILSKDGTGGRSWWIRPTDEGFYTKEVVMYTGGVKRDLDVNTDIAGLGEKYIVATYDGSNLKYFIDGVEDATMGATGSITGSSEPIRIGTGYNAQATYFFAGCAKDVGISNVARTADQIALFYDRPWDLYRRVARPIWSIPAGVTLTVAELTGAGILDSFGLTQKHAITVQELSSGGAVDNIVLTQKHLLALQELLSSGALDSIALIQKHLLTVQEVSGAGIIDNVNLTQKHLLAVQELLSSGAIDNIDLITAILLVVAELTSSSTLDNVDLTQKHILAVQELLSSGTLDNVELITAILLVVADLISSGALDSKTLTQKHILAIQEMLGGATLDSINLTQKHLLAVQELLSTGTLDALNLIVTTLLVVADLVSSGALDSNVLIQKHILTVQEVLSAGVLDTVALTQKQLLAIQDLLSSGIIDNINFYIATGLICISLSKSTEYDISLSKSTEYDISLSHKGGGVC